MYMNVHKSSHIIFYQCNGSPKKGTYESGIKIVSLDVFHNIVLRYMYLYVFINNTDQCIIDMFTFVPVCF